MDNVFCRNVFLYFRKEQIEQTMRNLLSQLKPWGVICLGVCENLNDMNLAISPLGHSIFVPKNSPHLIKPTAASSAASAVGAGSSGRRHTGTGPKETAVVIDAPPLRPQNIGVLAVDDSATVLALLKKVLTPADGFKVFATAKNLTEALAAVARLGRHFLIS
jgi:hypothetical protein